MMNYYVVLYKNNEADYYKRRTVLGSFQTREWAVEFASLVAERMGEEFEENDNLQITIEY